MEVLPVCQHFYEAFCAGLKALWEPLEAKKQSIKKACIDTILKSTRLSQKNVWEKEKADGSPTCLKQHKLEKGFLDE